MSDPTVVGYRGRGRPSRYKPMLDRIQGFSGEPEWHIIDRNQKTRTQPTQLRQRYDGFDFRCERNDQGKFNMLAKYVGDNPATAVSGREDER